VGSLSAPLTGSGVVTPLVLTPNTLVFGSVAGGSWTTLVEHVAKAEHLSLEAFHTGHVVAIWADPAFGVRYHEVP
jgi:hypothetical protein